MSQDKQPNVLDAINHMFGALEKGQSKGIYTFEESSKIFGAMTLTKKYFNQIMESQRKAMEQKQTITDKVSKLDI